jgi:hypothetical protein
VGAEKTARNAGAREQKNGAQRGRVGAEKTARNAGAWEQKKRRATWARRYAGLVRGLPGFYLTWETSFAVEAPAAA